VNERKGAPEQLKRTCTLRVVTKAAGKARTYRFVASTPSVDRAGDVIEPNWELEAFKATGMPILWGHDHFAPPIGRGVYVGVEGKNLVIDIEFAPADIYPHAGLIENLVDAGFIKSVSVGFKPIEYGFIEPRGMHITKSELLEISVVSVPMNAEALLVNRGLAPVFGGKLTRSDVLKGADATKVREFIRSPIQRSIMIIKADEPAPAAPEPAKDDIAAKCDEILALLTPKGDPPQIMQADLDAAVAKLNELKGTKPADDDADPAAEPEADDAKGLGAAAIADLVVKTIRDEFSRRDAELTLGDEDDDDPENADLEAAFADPDHMATLLTSGG